MDSNKNQECCYSNGGRCVSGSGGGGGSADRGLTVVIGPDCIAKAVSAAKYQNHFNNNNLIEQENLMPPVHDRVADDVSPSATVQQNGGIATSTDHHRASSSSPTTGGYTVAQLPASSSHVGTGDPPAAEVDHQAVAVNDDSIDPPDEGDFSDNNSLGNLSYASENGLIEEIILLPHNGYSDDDNASTSDDCIYAYRGGEPAGAAGQLLDLQGDLPPDDETDFLEMDFDPEPSSEMENFNRQQDSFLLALEGEQFASVARPPEGQQQEDGGGDSAARSPTVGRSEGAIEHSEVGPTTGEHHEQGNKTGFNHQKAEASEGRTSMSPPAPSVEQPEETKTNTHQERREKSTDFAGCNGPESPANRLEAHKTGAIPKNLPIPVERPNTKNLRLEHAVDVPDFIETHRYQDCSLYYYQPAEYAGGSTSKRSKGSLRQEDENETHCLDCAEQEFLMRTKQDHTRQRYCNVCVAKADGKVRSSSKSDHRLVRSYERDGAGSSAFSYPRTDSERSNPDEQTTKEDVDELLDLRAEQIVFETLHKINTLKEMPPTGSGVAREGLELSREKPTKSEPEENADGARRHAQYDQIVPLATHSMTQPEQSVTLYTVNCNEMHFGLSPKESVLRQYISERYEADDAKMTIPQYLLHMSKRNCNYKKLIDVIKSCCDMEPLDVQYYPIDPFSDAPEIVQICSSEIAKRWNANTNLRQIIHFKHKHFHTLNVLGKIVNILRQPARGRDTNYMISIPQYYKSGIIKIKRIAPSGL
uniref:Uncharacterized protein n=1 Tax=Anopheles epiroticus TaxID=199890 RepID=A0A182P8Q2_9DIPT